MGDIADDDLLNDDEEFDHEGYNLSDKEEDALLEGEDYDGGNLSHEYANPSSVHSDKKQTHEDSDDLEDDILDLDIEEDFQDVEDKTTFEEKPSEKRHEGKFSNERPPPSSNTTTNKVPVRAQVTKQVAPAAKPQSETNKTKVQNVKKAPQKIEKKRRGTGRGGFQSRGNFTRSNSQKERRLERRNTVFINPKYEGIVHLNENNARLAWDNSSYQQNSSHYIQPWASGSVPGNCDAAFQDPSLLITNLVSEIANISQTPANLFQVPVVQPNQNQTFFEPPQPPQLTFQVSNHQTFPSQTTRPPSYQSTGPQFSSQPLTDRYENDSNSYSSYGNYSYNRSNSQDYSLEAKKNFTSSSYDNRTTNYNRTLDNKQNPYENSKIDSYKTGYSNQDSYKNNFSNQDSYYKSSFPNEDNYYKSSYYNQDNYQTRGQHYLEDQFEKRETPLYNKNSIYNKPNTAYESRNLYKTTDPKEISYNRTTNTTFGNRNLTKNEVSNQNSYNATNFNSRQSFNQNQNNYSNYYKNDYNKTNTNQSFNRNLANQQNSNRRPALNEKIELPEKKPKTEEKINNEETIKKTEQSKQVSSNSNTAINDEEEDEEMRLYRLKIEEQKRQREKVLKMKEERRKMMLQQQKQEESSSTLESEKQQQQTVTTNVENINYKQSGASVPHQQRSTTVPQQQRSTPVPQQQRSTPVPQQQRSTTLPQQQRSTTVPQQQRSTAVPQQQRTNYHHQPVNRIPVLTTSKSQYFNSNNTPSPVVDEDELPNFTFKVSNDLQKTVPNTATMPKTEASSSSFMSNRVVIVKNSNSQKGGVLPNSSIVKTVAVSNEASNEKTDVGQGLSSFFNNRKVLKKDNTLINTRLVVINNLAASTTQNKLVAMTRGIGEIQKLHMENHERQATILFKSVASAHAFFKKYQRHMLDLSVIEVKLEPLI